MKTVKLISISEVKTEKVRTDGKVSRKYYTAYFADSLNPFAKQTQRNIFQDHNQDGTVAIWKSGDPAIVKNFIGKEIPGQIVNCSVAPYDINGRMVDSFTTVLLDGEKLSAILKQSGHTMAESAVVKQQSPEAILPLSSSTSLNN